MSKHFNDIWCWDLGEGGSSAQAGGRKLLLPTGQNAEGKWGDLRENWKHLRRKAGPPHCPVVPLIHSN